MRALDLLGRASSVPEPLAPGTVALEGEGIHLSIDGAHILEAVDVGVVAGEVLALVGPNGAGKSSLLGVLSGDLHATKGIVRLLGQRLHDYPAADLAVRRGVMLQQTTVAFSFTVRQVVAMGRAPWARTPYEDDDEQAVADALVATDVAHLADRSVTSLSGGELARVSFARVVAQAAPVSLLDEPTASLDLHHQELVMGLVREHATRGSAIAVVLHDLNLAASYADRVAVLANGHLVALGTPAEVLDADLLSAVYGHPIDVLPHPATGAPLVLPRRS